MKTLPGLLCAVWALLLLASVPALASPEGEPPEAQSLWERVGQLRDARHAAEALELGRQALALDQKALGPSHAAVGERTGDLAVLVREVGDFASAEPLFRRALEIQERALGSDHADVAITSSNLAELLAAKGDYVAAEPLYRRSLAILEAKRGANDVMVGTCLANFAGLLQDKGDYAGAEAMLRRALAIEENAFGLNHPEVAKTLSKLGWTLLNRGDDKLAEPLLRRALDIAELKLGPEHPQVGILLNSLGYLHRVRGDLAAAESLYRRSLAIREKALGPDDVGVATNLNNLALLLGEKHDYAAAEPLMRRALLVREKALGPQHPDLVTHLSSLQHLLEAQGDDVGAQPLLKRLLDIEDAYALRVMQAGSLRQKQALLATLQGTTFNAVSFNLTRRPGDPAALGLALRTVLRRKGLSAEIGGAGLQALAQRAEPADRQKLAELSRLQAQLAQLALTAPARGASQRHQAAVERTTRDVERLEEQLAESYAELRHRPRAIDVRAIQAALPEGSALVEYIVYRKFDPRAEFQFRFSDTHYAAYVLPARGEPSVVDLGWSLPIDRAASYFHDALALRWKEFEKTARALDSLVMAPVREKLGETTDVYVAPDGALNLIPFAALIDEQGHYLVERYRFNLLTTGRDLLRYRDRAAPRSPPVVVGAPDYGPRASGDDGRTGSSASPRGEAVDFGQAFFSPLPGALVESEAIGKLLRRATLLTGARATEEALKRVDGPSILHIATHGFFLAGQSQSIWSQRGLELARVDDVSGPKERVELPSDPMLRSGLALAGANARTREPKAGSDDGILTALEASGLRLWGTQLVVLSACETGVGQATDGDGVFGLRRALVLSGSETQLMSLWRVDDDATRALMTDYYQRVLAGAPRIDALRQVQLALLARPATREPYFWAAFIATGDSRTLDYRAAPPMQQQGSGDYRVRRKRAGCACHLAELAEPAAQSQLTLLPLALVLAGVGRRKRRPKRLLAGVDTNQDHGPRLSFCRHARRARRTRRFRLFC